MRFRHSRLHLANTRNLLVKIKISWYMQLILPFQVERTRAVARLADWVVGTDKMGRGDEYEKRAKEAKMHDCRNYVSFVRRGRKSALLSSYQLLVIVFIHCPEPG